MGFNKHFTYLCILLLGFTACKKVNQQEEQQQIDQQDGPLVGYAAENWRPIPNQYIVTYHDNTTSGNQPGEGIAQRQAFMQNITKSLLEGYNISPAKLIKTFNSG